MSNRSDTSGFINRTLSNLRQVWRGRPPGIAVAPDLPDGDVERLKRQIDACLTAKGGEVSARLRAAGLGQSYLGLSDEGRVRFLRVLAEDYDVETEALEVALARVNEAADADTRHDALRALRRDLLPPRTKLLTQFNALPQGVKFLVDMRKDLLALGARDDPALRRLDVDLRELLTSWFDIGFLDLERITWESPAALLEKLIDYEAVHRIRSWDDLKNRLDSDRRCYAFFHPRMPDEPLIFIEVALVKGIAGNVQELLDEAAPEQDPEAADAAIFYSISNAQAGLAGVSFGDFLIKRVADDLQRSLPTLKSFATLSPVPGFLRWLENRLEREGEDVFGAAEAESLKAAAEMEEAPAALRALLARDDWAGDAALAEGLKPILLRLAAGFLQATDERGRARDRVAHFHLSNGARLERLNWLGDTSGNGMVQSAGIMVNYLYRLADIEKNHEAYRGNGRIVAAPAVKKLG